MLLFALLTELCQLDTIPQCKRFRNLVSRDLKEPLLALVLAPFGPHPITVLSLFPLTFSADNGHVRDNGIVPRTFLYNDC